MHPIPASRNRPPATGLAAAALVSAVIPAAAGLAFLISLAARRPLVAVAARRWPWLTGRPAAQSPHRALTGRLALTSPASFTARALIALAAEAILAALTITWLHRSPAPAPQARSATPDPSLPPGLDRSAWQQQTAVTCRPMREEDVRRSFMYSSVTALTS